MPVYQLLRSDNVEGFLSSQTVYVDAWNALAEAQREQLIGAFAPVEGSETEQSVRFTVEALRHLSNEDHAKLINICASRGVELGPAE